MEKIEQAEILQQIGDLFAEEVQINSSKGLLYAEFGDRWISTVLFKDAGDRVIFFWEGDELSSKLLDLWAREKPSKRWTSMAYAIEGERFNVKFGYGEFTEKNVHDGEDERRNAVLREHFGDKPVEYPPL